MEDSIILFLEADSSIAATQFQRMNDRDKGRTFWVRTVPEAISILREYRERLDIVSLSYNLNGLEYTHPASPHCGMEVVRWLEHEDSATYSHTRFIIHSWCDPFNMKMTTRLSAKGYRAILIPFGS